MKSIRSRSYAALTVNGGSGSRPDSPLASQQDGGSGGPSFLLSPPPPFPVFSRSNAASARRAAAATIATVAAVLLATAGLLALVLGGAARSRGDGGGGGALRIRGEYGGPPTAFAWPPQLEAANAAADAESAADPASPAPPSGGRRRLELVIVVHRHGARTPLVFAYGKDEDAPVPYSRCPREYPGVGLRFRAFPSPPAAPGDGDDPPLAPGDNVDEGEPVMPGDGSCRLGTLTRRGYAQALRLGLWLRARYCRDGGGDGGDGGGGGDGAAAAAAAAAASQKRLSCSSLSSSASFYSSRLRRTVATLRGVLTGLVADEQLTHELLRALESDEEEEEEAAGAGGDGGSGGLGNNNKNSPLPTFTVDQCARHGLEFMYGKSSSCSALSPLVRAAETAALRADAREPAARRAAIRAAKEVLGRGKLGEGEEEEEEEEEGESGEEAVASAAALDWRRLRDVVTAMLAEKGARGGLRLLPLPPLRPKDEEAADADAASGTPRTTTPSKALLKSLGDTMAYAARREARIIAPPDSKRDRTVALSIGPLCERIRAAVAEAAAKAAAAEEEEEEGKNGEPRLVVYSGHDSTLMPLLTALGAAEENAWWPPYASSLVFEVWGREAAAGKREAHHASDGRRERAGGKQPSAADEEDGSALVRVLHDGRLFQERRADELVAALGAWALDDGARARECAAAKAGR